MRSVLVIEDDPPMNEHIADVLRRGGFQVASAFDGRAGLEAIRNQPPDIVILDIFMPEKDGLEALVQLRSFAPNLPVLVISGRQHLLSGASMSLAQQLGATDVLAKPFMPKELLNRVTALVRLLAVPTWP